MEMNVSAADHQGPLFSYGFTHFGDGGIPRSGFADLFVHGAIWPISSPNLPLSTLMPRWCCSPLAASFQAGITNRGENLTDNKAG